MDLEGFCKSIQNLKYVYPVDFNKSEIISQDDFIKINIVQKKILAILIFFMKNVIILKEAFLFAK